MSPDLANDSNGAANSLRHDEGSGMEFTMIETPSFDSNGTSAIAEAELADGMSDIHISETTAARRQDEYDVDFE